MSPAPSAGKPLDWFWFNGPFAASGHMVHAGGQAAHWDIQNKATSSR